ncbi:MAG: DUF4157 domain-containing protein [Myxococcales bacterium]|nr:DUF4157 domain-containing protein [Myxococcales bacterium]
MSDRARRPPGSDHEPEIQPATTTARSRRAGGGLTTRSIPPRPTGGLPQPAPQAAVQHRDIDPSRAVAQTSQRRSDSFTLIEGLDWDRDVIGRVPPGDPALLQAKSPGDLDPTTVQAHATAGVSGPAQALPHQSAIQAAFGHHDVRSIRAHVGGAAADASAAIGAQAYATGDAVAFHSSPDLHLAAHEAAHVVQQRAGVQLKGGVGQTGDRYEQHADAVADRVVAGRSAVDLLDQLAPHGTRQAAVPDELAPHGTGQAAVQRKGRGDAAGPPPTAALVADGASEARVHAAHAAIEVTKARIPPIMAKAESAATTSAAARANLIAVAWAMFEPLQAFAQAATETDPAVVAAVARARPDVIDALNEVARASLVIDRGERFQTGALGLFGAGGAAVSPSNAAELRSVLATLATAGRALDWRAPTSIEAADTARHDHEPCPIGASPVHPEECPYTDAKRAELRGQLVTQGIHLVDLFDRACDVQKDALEPLLKASAEARRATLDVFQSSIKVGIGLYAPGLNKVVGLVIDQAIGQAKAALAKVALDPSPAAKTITMLKRLVSELRAQMRELDRVAMSVADEQLTLLIDGLRSISEDTVKARVKDFVDRYRAQIEPIGSPLEHRDSAYQMRPERGEGIGARIRINGKPRAALVNHIVEHNPIARISGGKPNRRETFRFVRWLDDDMATMAGPLEDLDATQVTGLPLADLMRLETP